MEDDDEFEVVLMLSNCCSPHMMKRCVWQGLTTVFVTLLWYICCVLVEQVLCCSIVLVEQNLCCSIT